MSLLKRKEIKALLWICLGLVLVFVPQPALGLSTAFALPLAVVAIGFFALGFSHLRDLFFDNGKPK